MPMNYFLFPHCFDTSHTRAGKKSSKSDTSKHWHVFIGMKLSSISRSVLSVVYLARALSLGAAADYLFREIKHWQIYEEVIRTAQNQFATPFCFKTLTNFMSPEIAHKTPDVYQIVDISSTWYMILVNNCDQPVAISFFSIRYDIDTIWGFFSRYDTIRYDIRAS